MPLSDVNPDTIEMLRQIKKCGSPLTCTPRRMRRPGFFDNEEDDGVFDVVHGVSLGEALGELQKIHTGSGEW